MTDKPTNPSWEECKCEWGRESWQSGVESEEQRQGDPPEYWAWGERFASMETGGYSRTHVLPRPVSAWQRLETSAIVGAGSYLVWKFVIAGLLILHFLNTYVYFGKHPFWAYVNATARKLLSPLGKIPLRVGKMDFAPVAGIALTFLAAKLLQEALVWLYARLAY